MARHGGPDCGIPTDATFRLFRCVNARVRKEDRNDELVRFIGFREERNGEPPREPVFDSRLTTHANLGRINAMGIDFLTLRRRTASLPDAIGQTPSRHFRRSPAMWHVSGFLCGMGCLSSSPA